jgi:hypothetical protein
MNESESESENMCEKERERVRFLCSCVNMECLESPRLCLITTNEYISFAEVPPSSTKFAFEIKETEDKQEIFLSIFCSLSLCLCLTFCSSTEYNTMRDGRC